MEYRIVYEGPLKANSSVADKQHVRRVLHSQLKRLWTQLPLSEHQVCIAPDRKEKKPWNIRPVGSFRFAPLVTEELRLIAELNIVFLRPEPPGSLLTQGGDIDNRLKTLFDALRMPKAKTEMPNGDLPGPDEDPFFCLLEDDNLVSAVTVHTDRLLKATPSRSHVHLLISVTTKPTVATWGNISL